MTSFAQTASLEKPWWINSDKQIITPYDYSDSRLKAAQKHIKTHQLTIEMYLNRIKKNATDDFTLLMAISSLLQEALIHNPVFQPSEKKSFSFKNCIRSAILMRPLEKHQLVYDPLLLLLLGEARCGQVAHVLVTLLDRVGIKSKVEKLQNHIVANVLLNGDEYLIDADGFKNNIFFFKDTKMLYTRKEILNTPTLVDQFKHTGWMFRRNTRYAQNADRKNFTGYIDFFMPENDGLISGKFGNHSPYKPPGIPIWDTPGKVFIKPTEKLNCAFAVPYSQRADYFLVRICKKTKGYNYNHLVYKNLLNESDDIVEEIKTTDMSFVFSVEQRGQYYITACSMSDYLEHNKCYVWWSDELKITVK